MRRTVQLFCVVVLFASGCGGSKGSKSPQSPSDTPGTPAASAVSGRIVANPGGNGVSGATLEVDGNSVTADGNGNFTVPAANNDRKVRVTAAGYLGRETWLHGGGRSGVSIDLIANVAPFSLDFYRTIARGAGSTTLQPLRRWETNPSFYIKTTDQAGHEVPSSAIAVIENTLRQSVTQITSGHLNVARIEHGSGARPMTPGWINVELTTDLNYKFCGESLVGSNPGHILLNATTKNKCGSVLPSPGCIGHEVGHALGLWHTPAPSRMQATGAGAPPCQTGDLTGNEKYHTAILYSRPRDNMDTDIDPGSFQLLMPEAASSSQSSAACALQK